MEKTQQVIFGRDEICKAYGFGRKTFNWLIAKGAPIKMTDGRYFVHRETLDRFFIKMTVETEQKKEEKRKKASR